MACRNFEICIEFMRSSFATAKIELPNAKALAFLQADFTEPFSLLSEVRTGRAHAGLPERGVQRALRDGDLLHLGAGLRAGRPRNPMGERAIEGGRNGV